MLPTWWSRPLSAVNFLFTVDKTIQLQKITEGTGNATPMRLLRIHSRDFQIHPVTWIMPTILQKAIIFWNQEYSLDLWQKQLISSMITEATDQQKSSKSVHNSFSYPTHTQTRKQTRSHSVTSSLVADNRARNTAVSRRMCAVNSSKHRGTPTYLLKCNFIRILY